MGPDLPGDMIASVNETDSRDVNGKKFANAQIYKVQDPMGEDVIECIARYSSLEVLIELAC